jgi:hypothetical protein
LAVRFGREHVLLGQAALLNHLKAVVELAGAGVATIRPEGELDARISNRDGDDFPVAG